MAELLQMRGKHPGEGEVCSTTTCEQIAAIKERFYSTLPPMIGIPLAQEKFEGFRATLESQDIYCQSAICLPLLQLTAKINGGESD